MKRLILGLMVLSSLVLAGDKIKFTEDLVMCSEKTTKIMPYMVFMTIYAKKGYKLSDLDKEIRKSSNNNCQILTYSRNIIGKILKIQKDSIEGTVFNYINFKVLSIEGKDFSGLNQKMWTISLPSASTYKTIN